MVLTEIVLKPIDWIHLT